LREIKKHTLKIRNTPDQIRTGVAGSKVRQIVSISENQQRIEENNTPSNKATINDSNTVYFDKTDLNNFVSIKTKRLSKGSIQWINKVTGYIWSQLNGKINIETMNKLSDFFLTQYPNTESVSSIHKCFMYTRGFLNYLYRFRMDSKILAYHSIFERPKTRQPRKLLTSRIIVQEDISTAITEINNSTLPEDKILSYQTLLLFLSYSGQRTVTASRLTVSQFKSALEQNPPVLLVNAEQDKLRMEHFVPLHPVLIPYIVRIIKGKVDTDLVFDYLGLQRWLKHHPISMSHTKGKLEQKDIRKFFEQKSDEIGFTDANKNFIMSHGVSSINWTSYKQFLPENVYRTYMKYWGNVRICQSLSPF